MDLMDINKSVYTRKSFVIVAVAPGEWVFTANFTQPVGCEKDIVVAIVPYEQALVVSGCQISINLRICHSKRSFSVR